MSKPNDTIAWEPSSTHYQAILKLKKLRKRLLKGLQLFRDLETFGEMRELEVEASSQGFRLNTALFLLIDKLMPDD